MKCKTVFGYNGVMPPKDLSELLRYWHGISDHEYEFARKNHRSDAYPLQVLFHLHLSVEALLKACIVYRQHEHAPYSHNLEYLAGYAGLKLSKQKVENLTALNKFNITGRYPEDLEYINQLDKQFVNDLFKKIEDLIKWLKKQF